MGRAAINYNGMKSSSSMSITGFKAFSAMSKLVMKGNVESKVGYHRRNWLVPVPRFERLSDFNQDLLKICDADAER